MLAAFYREAVCRLELQDRWDELEKAEPPSETTTQPTDHLRSEPPSGECLLAPGAACGGAVWLTFSFTLVPGLLLLLEPLKSALPSLLLAAAREREVNSRGTARPASPNKTEPAPPGDVLRNPPRAGEIELEGKKEL